jgi:hypothetical protein
MELSDILVLARKEGKEIEKLVSDTGRKWRKCVDLNVAMKKLRGGNYGIVVVDYAHAPTDVLEFLLNVRDVAEEARVFVVGSDPAAIEKELGNKTPWVSFVDPEVLRHKLTPTVLNVECATTGRIINSRKEI